MANTTNYGRVGAEHYQGTQAGTAPVGRHEETGFGAVASAVKDKVEDVKEKVQDFAGSAASRAEDAWDCTVKGARQAAAKAGDFAGDACNLMSRYPLATLLAGAAAGFILYKALSNRFPHSWESFHFHDNNRPRGDYPFAK